MKAVQTTLPEVLILDPTAYEDERGFFCESFNERRFSEETRMPVPRFVQNNHSKSARNVLRGLHYQIQQPQGKLLHVINDKVLDVGGRYPAIVAAFRKMGWRDNLGEEPAAALDSGRIRPRLLGGERQRGFPVQDDRLLGI
jgi:hypothetical protein